MNSGCNIHHTIDLIGNIFDYLRQVLQIDRNRWFVGYVMVWQNKYSTVIDDTCNHA